MAFCLLSCGLFFALGRDFFPAVDAGQVRLHMRLPTGTRIEETARAADEVEAAIRELVPADQLETVLDNLGVPNSGINLSYSNAGTIGTLDGEIQIALKKDHQPTAKFVTILRRELPRRFPGIEFFFQPADIVTQILNFGLPAAIDVQFTGNNVDANAALAAALNKQIQHIPGAVDSPRAPAPGRAVDQPRHGSRPPAADRPERAERRPERADRAVGQLADRARVLAQPAERHRLQHRGADAAVQRRLARRAARHAGGHRRQRRRRPPAPATRSCWATWSR